MARAKLSGRQIMQLFYTEVDRSLSTSTAEKDPDLSTVFRCKCGKMRSQKLKHGYTNLVQHVLMKHSDWVTAAFREAFPSPTPALSSTINSPRLKKLRPAKVEAETKVLCSDDGTPGNLIGSVKEENVASQLTVKVQEPTASLKVQKRSQYLSWDDYFMSVAFLSAMRSKGWWQLMTQS
uniref:Uncharacterized protein n=1 Tax=Hyaloperonospora arabidopsidis (strain Emoy2) TaxID=559515 RepID=M4BGC5_HYAAE